MLVTNALEAIKDAKREKTDWREVSGIVGEILQTRAWRDKYENMSAWLESAGEVSGYSPSMLRRMVAVRDFLSRAKEEFGEPEILTDTTTRAPFAAMELLKRIHDIDPGKAKEVFGQILTGDVSHRDVQAIYQSLSGAAAMQQRRSDGRQDPKSSNSVNGRKQFNTLLQLGPELVDQNLAMLTGDIQARAYFREFRFAYASPTAVALRYKDNGIAWIDAFDLRWSGKSIQGIKRKQMLAEIAFGATFFRNYWVVIDQADDVANALAKDAQVLSLHSVGIAMVDAKDPDKLHVIKKPELSAQPDRQYISIKEVLTQGIPDLVSH
ncbi:hypothetical protein [Kordiimonas marina]|uniref:hypothetical protein n=1 Tax=Kordiimonas marina TaxID=2872312 RepID=UPI001FF1F7F1|nr:hypothetical protein [Kordiimonas marina]MCJ9430021.1 hypothetical protein [Kordiimonas marina]